MTNHLLSNKARHDSTTVTSAGAILQMIRRKILVDSKDQLWCMLEQRVGQTSCSLWQSKSSFLSHTVSARHHRLYYLHRALRLAHRLLGGHFMRGHFKERLYSMRIWGIELFFFWLSIETHNSKLLVSNSLESFRLHYFRTSNGYYKKHADSSFKSSITIHRRLFYRKKRYYGNITAEKHVSSHHLLPWPCCRSKNS